MKRLKTNELVLVAVLADISLILYMLSYRTDSMRITLYGLPLLIAGMLYGWRIGLFAGLVGGLMMQMLCHPISPTTVLWVLAPMLWGGLSGFIGKMVKGEYTIKKVMMVVIPTSLIITLVNSGAMWIDGLVYDYPTPYVISGMILRLGLSIATACVNIILSYEAIRRLKKIKKLEL